MKDTLKQIETPTDCTQPKIPVKETPPLPGETVLPVREGKDERREDGLGAAGDEEDEDAPTEIDPMCGLLQKHHAIFTHLEDVEGKNFFCRVCIAGHLIGLVSNHFIVLLSQYTMKSKI